MLHLVLISLIQIGLGFMQTRHEVGDIIVMVSGGKHILENSRGYPRQIQTQINFQVEFDISPELFISPHYLDWDLEMPAGFNLKVTLITKTGFLLSTLAGLSPAFTKQGLVVVTFYSIEEEILQTGSGERTITFSIDHKLKDAKNGVISLIGAKHTQDDQIVEVKILQIRSYSVDVSVSTYSDSQVEFVKFNILLGTDDSLWSSPAQAEIFNPSLAGNLGHSSRQATFVIPSNYLVEGRLPIFAYRGYKFDKGANVRCYKTDVSLTSNLIYNLFVCMIIVQYCKIRNLTFFQSYFNLKRFIFIIQQYLGYTTVAYAFYNQAALYFPKANEKICQPNCAELFSECNYSGDSIKICNNIPDISQLGWSKQIASLMISTNKILYLFNQINYLGSAIQFKENQQCIQAQSKLSAKFYPANSIIKVLFINTEITNNNCNYVYFYSQCNYQGTNYQIQQGNQLDRSNKISFEIKSIKICPNVIVKLRGPTYFGGNDQVFSSSQISLQSYQFPSYRAPS